MNKTLQECKNDVAAHAGYKDFEELFKDISSVPDQDIFDLYYDSIATLYAKSCAEQALKDAAENVYDAIDCEWEQLNKVITSTPIVTP